MLLKLLRKNYVAISITDINATISQQILMQTSIKQHNIRMFVRQVSALMGQLDNQP